MKPKTMKLLLTSSGLRNQTLTDGLSSMLGKPFADSKLVFIPTAANVEEGDKSWFIDDLNNFYKLGFGSIDIVDISAVSRQRWEKALGEADVIAVSGGNTFHLAYWMEKSGLKDAFPELLKTRVYVGVSAGSCVMGPKVLSKVQDFFADEKNEFQVEDGLNYVNFLIIPHYASEYYPHITEENVRKKAEEERYPIYAIDDDCAISVIDDSVEVIGEGRSLVLDK